MSRATARSRPSTARTMSQATRSRATVPSRPSTAPTMSPRTRSRATSIAAASRSGPNFEGPGSRRALSFARVRAGEDRGVFARLGKYQATEAIEERHVGRAAQGRRDRSRGPRRLPAQVRREREAGEDDENDFEAHMARYPNVRMD